MTVGVGPDDHLLVSDVPPGTFLAGRYRVRSKLGEGAVASVYLADDEAVRERVALKILDPLRSLDPVGRARFMRELEVLSRLRHPGVARSLRFEAHGDLEILVLEVIEGETLAAKLARGPLGAREAKSLGIQLARALEACHRAGVLHRDLKPANVMLHPERGAVILDFGVAWFSSAATLTKTGSVIGSPRYLAPELFRSSHADARSEVYALGAILYEALTGRPVRPEESVASLASASLTHDAPLVSALRRDVSPRLAAVIARAIAPYPEDRFATAAELADALQHEELAPTRPLQPQIPCKRCGSPSIIDLALCPGCGAEQVWELREGPYAVQLTSVPEPEQTLAWLVSRHRATLATRPGMIASRLRFLPVPLAVGVSRASAEQLLAEAGEAGCRGELVGARAIIGARVRASQVSVTSAFVASVLHGSAVMLVALISTFFGVEGPVLYAIPGVLGVLGAACAAIYVRRPVLRPRSDGSARKQARSLEGLRAALAGLTTARARGLAAGAVARAAPALLGDVAGLSEDARRDIDAHLASAIAAAREVDVHAAAIAARPRARLAHELDDAAARAERGVPGAEQEHRALEAEKRALTEAAIAHDLAARRALEASAAITAVLLGRSAAVEEAAELVARGDVLTSPRPSASAPTARSR